MQVSRLSIEETTGVALYAHGADTALSVDEVVGEGTLFVIFVIPRPPRTMTKMTKSVRAFT